MSLVLVEGWDHCQNRNAKGWAQAITGASATDQSTYVGGRLGGNALRLGVKCATNVSPASIVVDKLLPSTYSTIICGFAFRRISSTPVDQDFFDVLTSGAGLIGSLRFNGSGNVYVCNSSGGTVVTSSKVTAQDSWYYYELKIVINGASGSCELRRDGGADIATTTGNFGSTNAGKIRFRTFNGTTNGTSQVDFDDVVVLDTSGSAPRNTFIGDVKVETVFPTGAGNTTQFIPVSGSNWAAVDDPNNPDDDTTYVEDSTAGDKDTYATGNLGSTTATVFGVQVNIYAKKTDAGSHTICNVVRQSSTDYDGATSPGLTTSYAYYSEIREQDPTGSDWTGTNVNADEFGFKNVT